MYKYHTYVFLLITLSFCNHTILSMNELNLNTLEKDIFLQQVNYVGMESLSKKITQECAKKFFCLTIEFKFYTTEINNPLTQSIAQKIIEKESKNGYLPHGKMDKITGNFAIPPTNFLGGHTRYWYGSDEKGDYITCTSTFTRKEVLERLLKEIKKKYYGSNL